jgi:hypothetical protein
VEDEAARANALLSRGDMEGVMVVHLAGRAAEKMVMGEAEVRWICVSTKGLGSALYVSGTDQLGVRTCRMRSSKDGHGVA